MRRRFMAVAAVALAGGLACAAPAARPASEAEVARISAEELKKAMDAKGVVVLDVRGQAPYAASHLPGARLWDESQADQLVETLKASGKAVVTYCT